SFWKRSVALAICGCTGLAFAATGPVSNCNVSSMQSYSPAGTTVASADVVAATTAPPQHCLVKGTTTTVNNSITWAVGLPTAWNDKLYWGAQGGFAGSAPVPPALGLQQGYVRGIHDTGHPSGGTDGSWALNSPDKVIDFGHRGIKASVDVGKAMVAGYYQSPIKRSIMASCSNGGRATMIPPQGNAED